MEFNNTVMSSTGRFHEFRSSSAHNLQSISWIKTTLPHQLMAPLVPSHWSDWMFSYRGRYLSGLDLLTFSSFYPFTAVSCWNAVIPASKCLVSLGHPALPQRHLEGQRAPSTKLSHQIHLNINWYLTFFVYGANGILSRPGNNNCVFEKFLKLSRF